MRGKPHRKGHHARPRTIRPRADEAQPAAETGASATTATRRKCVLVVEDNATIGGLLVALLREEGYRALRACDENVMRGWPRLGHPLMLMTSSCVLDVGSLEATRFRTSRPVAGPEPGRGCED